MTDRKDTIPQNDVPRVYLAPWEKAFDRVLTPFEEFIQRQTTTGLLLMSTAIIALLIANSPLLEPYLHLVHLPIGITIGHWTLEQSLHHWINDGLMTLFFFVVGLELKREMLVGELARPRQAALPIIAAIGGMLMPALIFFAFNPDAPASRGWGIPMATDIAFAIGALVLLANRVPKALITFLVALAIADDLGAVIVIALFYTDTLVVEALIVALLLLGVLISFNLGGIRKVTPYFVVAVGLWYALLESGVHATLAGVLGAMTVPARPKYDPTLFSAQVGKLMAQFDASHRADHDIMTNEQLHSIVQSLEQGTRLVATPLQRLEHAWHLPVSFLVIPVFALFNAGIPLDFQMMGDTLTHPVTLGVMLGLVLGKFIGITLACWLALKCGIGQLPAQTRFSQIAGVALLAGIGFTMAIFIAELGYADQPELLLMAKTGILAASLLAGVSGFIWLWWAGGKPRP